MYIHAGSALVLQLCALPLLAVLLVGPVHADPRHESGHLNTNTNTNTRQLNTCTGSVIGQYTSYTVNYAVCGMQYAVFKSG
jgi:hypothetical protein